MARLGRVMSARAVISPARSRAIVVTATPPALITANQEAISHGLFGPRSSTRLPGTRPNSSTSTRAAWLARPSRSP